ncbi:MAG: UbiA family prenyltransferase [Bacteroidetes bacterium]|nr:UbiA family prenyltransferase [Bacteroidota bacterium]MDA1121883.1 UbiA family prenyltransferase [Bacteroidota bacterium]
MQKSTLLHLRFPFSFFLLPVYLFALSTSNSIDLTGATLTFILLHFFLYPASNGYNSFFDKDEESIGGLKNPPVVTKELYYTSLALDFIALVLGALFINLEFMLLLLAYGLASKAYSHPALRIKKFPILGWITAFFFQGYFTFLMAYVGINKVSLIETFEIQVQFPAILSSLLLGGSYPMTQIYQHKEDAKRGDNTISRKLGVLGTFHFTAVFFIIANAGFVIYFLEWFEISDLVLFQIALTPSLVYFALWYFKVRKDSSLANYQSTMRLNLLSSAMLNLFFLMQVLSS